MADSAWHEATDGEKRERVKCIFYGIPGVEFNTFLLPLSPSSIRPPLSIIDEFCGRCSERESERGIHLHTNIMLNNSRMADREAEGVEEGRPNRYSISDAGMPTVPHRHDARRPARPAAAAVRAPDK